MNNDRSEFSIGVVSKLTGINPGTLRMWEKDMTVFLPSVLLESLDYMMILISNG